MKISLSPDARAFVQRAKEEHSLDASYGLRLSYEKNTAGKRELTLDLEQGPNDKDESWNASGHRCFCSRKTALLLGRDVLIRYDSDKGGFVIGLT